MTITSTEKVTGCRPSVCGVQRLCCWWGYSLHSAGRRQISSSCRHSAQVQDQVIFLFASA